MKRFGSPKCTACAKPVYGNEGVTIEGQLVHRTCLMCSKCNKKLDPDMAKMHEGKLYCSPHLREATGGPTAKPTVVISKPSSTAPAPVADCVSSTGTPAQPIKPSAAKGMAGMPMGIPMPGSRPGGSLSKRIFTKFDREGNGHMSFTDFQAMCQEMGYRLNDKELEMSVKLLDTDGNGTLEYDEFLSWWSSDERFAKLHIEEDQLEFLTEAFRKFISFDIENSGVLSRQSFAGLHAFLIEAGHSNKTCEDLWDDMDTDRSGTISFNEYVDFLLRLHSEKLKVLPQGIQLPPLKQ